MIVDAAAVVLLDNKGAGDREAARILASTMDGWSELDEKRALEAVKKARAMIAKAREKSLKRRLSLKAKGFSPKPGEEPDDEGRYWRTTETGRRYPIKEGDDPEERVAEVIGTAEAGRHPRFRLSYKPDPGSKEDAAGIKALAQARRLVGELPAGLSDGVDQIDVGPLASPRFRGQYFVHARLVEITDEVDPRTFTEVLLHELGHSVFWKMSVKDRRRWAEVADKYPPTKYAKSFINNLQWNPEDALSDLRTRANEVQAWVRSQEMRDGKIDEKELERWDRTVKDIKNKALNVLVCETITANESFAEMTSILYGGRQTGDPANVRKLKRLYVELINKYADKNLRGALKASGFTPKPGEEPDKDGLYWRTVRGRRIPFREGEDFQRKITESAPGAKPEKPGGGEKPGKEAEKKKPGGRAAKPDFSKMPEFAKDSIEAASDEMANRLADVDRELRRHGRHLEDVTNMIEDAVDAGEITEAQADVLKGTSGSLPVPTKLSVGNETVFKHDIEKRNAERRKLWEELAEKSGDVKKALAAADSLGGDVARELEYTGTLYRGTDVDELRQVLKKGGIGERGDSGWTSLSTDAGIAAHFASGHMWDGIDRSDGVLIEYGKDSVKGKMHPARYGFIQPPGAYNGVEFAPENEVRVEAGSPADITGVTMTEEAARANADLVGAIKEAGIELTVIDDWRMVGYDDDQYDEDEDEW